MASLAEIYDWFMTGKKPTQLQFWASWGSFWNKGEQIPQSSISGLPGVLNAKAEKAQFDAHKTDENAHAALFDVKEDKSQKGVAGGYVPLDEFVKISNEYLTIVNDLVTGGATSLASAETVKTLKTQIDGINTILTSNDVNLDTVQEVVDAIKTVQTSLSTILVNDLTTGGTTKALTSEMGKTLKGLIDGLVVPTATDVVRGVVKTDVTVADPVVYVKETVDTLLEGKANYFLDIKTITGITYNVILTDILHELVYGGTLPMNVIIPNNTTVAFPIGTIFYTLGTNTGIITASGASGVTLSLKAGLSLSAIQNEVRQYTKIGTNTWSVRGDLNLGAVTQTELSYLQGATSNLQAQINAKTALSGGTANFLMKWLTATTATVSRIWDTGTFLGIGTVNTPTKDLTFGNQANREIGIEESGINSIGKNLKITAGRTVNYIVGSPIVALPGSPAGASSGANVCGMYVTPTDDIVLVNNSTTIYTKLSGSSTWTASTINVALSGICRASNGNVYGVGNNLIYMQPGGTGNFVSVGAPSRSYTDVCSAPNGNIYACVNNGSIFMQTAGVGTFNDLSQTTRAWTGMCTLSNGNVYAGTYGSGIYMQTAGTGNFVLVQSGVSANKMFSTLTNDVYAISELVGYLSKQTAGTGTFTTISGATTAGSTAWKSGISTSNGDLYFINDIAIYRQEISSAGLPNLDGGDLVMIAGTGKGTGKSTIKFYTGQKSASGTTMQVETLREYIDENGYHIYTSMPVHADNAAALAGGLPLGCEYRTATGIKMIVY